MGLTTLQRWHGDDRRLAPSRPGGLTTLVALIVVGVMPSMLGVIVAPGQRTVMLEVRAVTPRIDPPGEIVCADLSAPRAILMRVSRDDVLVGEEQRTPRRIRAMTALQRHLRGLKNARPERTHVIMRVDDGVSLQRMVDVFDMLLALELQAIDVDVSPGNSVFREDTWARPPLAH